MADQLKAWFHHVKDNTAHFRTTLITHIKRLEVFKLHGCHTRRELFRNRSAWHNTA